MIYRPTSHIHHKASKINHSSVRFLLPSASNAVQSTFLTFRHSRPVTQNPRDARRSPRPPDHPTDQWPFPTLHYPAFPPLPTFHYDIFHHEQVPQEPVILVATPQAPLDPFPITNTVILRLLFRLTPAPCPKYLANLPHICAAGGGRARETRTAPPTTLSAAERRDTPVSAGAGRRACTGGGAVP